MEQVKITFSMVLADLLSEERRASNKPRPWGSSDKYDTKMQIDDLLTNPEHYLVCTNCAIEDGVMCEYCAYGYDRPPTPI